MCTFIYTIVWVCVCLYIYIHTLNVICILKKRLAFFSIHKAECAQQMGLDLTTCL